MLPAPGAAQSWSQAALGLATSQGFPAAEPLLIFLSCDASKLARTLNIQVTNIYMPRAFFL